MRIANVSTPEEDELELKRAELEAAESLLAEQELELATLTADLRAFEAAYSEAVGALAHRLEQLNARIICGENGSGSDWQAQTDSGDAPNGHCAGFMPSEEVKSLYRRLARAVHPDLCLDPAEQATRTKIMAEVNAAYADGNADRLKELLAEWNASPDAVPGTDTAALLVRTIRKLAQVNRRIATITAKLTALKDSDLYRLKHHVDEARAQGRDLVAEMRDELAQQVRVAEARLAALRPGRNQYA